MNITHLKKQAKALAKVYPQLVGEFPTTLPLHAAQRTIATMHGYPSWETLAAAPNRGKSKIQTSAKTEQVRLEAMRGLAYIVRIGLEGTGVWRRIEISTESNFWQLHVAIQDAMGWLDYHLHEFRIPGEPLPIGIDLKESDVEQLFDGTELLVNHLVVGNTITYTYDYGDHWVHKLKIEGLVRRAAAVYPRCTGGALAAPPEDCGGVDGFEKVKAILGNKRHREYVSTREWLEKRHAKCYWPFDPKAFNPDLVVFSDAFERFGKVFVTESNSNVQGQPYRQG